MNILSIDSSTKNISIAVSSNNKLLGEISDSKSLKHMVNITGFMDSALSRAGIVLEDIDAYSVNTGPGDFTGTRIGVTIIKTLAWAQNKPAFGIGSLDAFALGIIHDNENIISRNLREGISPYIMPCLDVRRGELYFALYSLVPATSQEDPVLAEKDEEMISIALINKQKYFVKKISISHLVHSDSIEESLASIINEKKVETAAANQSKTAPPLFLIEGNYYNNYKDLFSGIAGKEKSLILTKKTVYPKARHLNAIAHLKMINGSEHGKLMPAYIREFIPFGGKDQK